MQIPYTRRGSLVLFLLPLPIALRSCHRLHSTPQRETLLKPVFLELEPQLLPNHRRWYWLDSWYGLFVRVVTGMFEIITHDMCPNHLSCFLVVWLCMLSCDADK